MRKTRSCPRRLRFACPRRIDARLLRRLIELYRAAGWWYRGDTPAMLRRLIGGSHCFLVVKDRGKAMGMGRAISDGASDAYIQDVFVEEAYRGQGIGAEIVRRLARRLASDRVRWIGLIAVPGSRSFYEGLGFRLMRRFEPMLLKG
jgi:aralkylamine N-acetyltransferase